jgi:hypothetical protein
MTLVVIDTSVLIGLIDARDVWHRAALQLQAALRAARLTSVHFECTIEFIPIKSWAARGAGVPGSYAGHSRPPSPDRGRLLSTGGYDL